VGVSSRKEPRCFNQQQDCGTREKYVLILRGLCLITTAFGFRLPVEKTESCELKTEVYMGAKDKNDVRILVVDDQQNVADTVVEIMTRSGYTATAIYGGMEAVKRFQEGDFQLVITDLKMPEVDGMDLLKTVKGIDDRVPVIVITGYGTVKKAVEAIKIGAYDFIEKPVDRDKLLLIVERALERHSLFKQLGVFRGLTLALTISIPFWLILGIILARAWK